MPVAILPWRGGCPHRQAALNWIRGLYTERLPGWNVVVAEPPPGPWCKAAAVMPAVERCGPDEVVAVIDADVWCEGLPEAFRAIEVGAIWALPHRDVHRLTRDGTAAALRGADLDGLPLERHPQRGTEPYPGIEGGGAVVARRETLLDCPLDRRFTGWGQEDDSWGIALWCLYGPPWRGDAPLWHLWHPPQERLSRRWGSVAGKRLRRRYVTARKDPDRMRALLEEAR